MFICVHLWSPLSIARLFAADRPNVIVIVSDDQGYGVRDEDQKLVISGYKHRSLLFDLKRDPGERHDLATQNPELVKRLTGMIENWDRENRSPLWLDPHGENVAKEEAARQSIIEKSLPPTKTPSR